VADTDERYTPQRVLDVVRAVAPIGLDPCTTKDNPTKARFFYTPDEDGSTASWALCPPDELIYVNPPYSRGMLAKWAAKVVHSAQQGREIIMLTPCDLGTIWATTLFNHADALAGWRGRIAFEFPNGEYDVGAKQPSLLWYFGERGKRIKRIFDDHSNCILLRGS
jgi:phage N-6-adenine-methyltransferase